MIKTRYAPICPVLTLRTYSSWNAKQLHFQYAKLEEQVRSQVSCVRVRIFVLDQLILISDIHKNSFPRLFYLAFAASPYWSPFFVGNQPLFPCLGLSVCVGWPGYLPFLFPFSQRYTHTVSLSLSTGYSSTLPTQKTYQPPFLLFLGLLLPVCLSGFGERTAIYPPSQNRIVHRSVTQPASCSTASSTLSSKFASSSQTRLTLFCLPICLFLFCLLRRRLKRLLTNPMRDK